MPLRGKASPPLALLPVNAITWPAVTRLPTATFQERAFKCM